MDIMPKLPIPPIPPEQAPKIWEVVKKLGKRIISAILGRNEEDIKNSKGYDPEKSNADEILELNRLVCECRDSFGASAKEMEKEIKNQCAEMIDDILEVLEGMNKNLNVYRVESIRRQLNNILDDIDGSMTDHIRQSISLDNSKCVSVLKLPAGELKGTRMKELKIEVFNEALDRICKTVRRTVQNVLYNVEDSFDSKIEIAEEQAEKLSRQFDALSQSSQESRSEKEKIIANAGFINSLADLGTQILGEGVV